MPVVQPPGDLPATERTSRLGQPDPAARGDRTILLDESGLRGSGTDQGIGQSAPGSRDSAPIMAASRLSADAETATATGMSLPEPSRHWMWIGVAALVVVLGSAAAYAAITLIGSSRQTEVAVATEPAKPTPAPAKVELPPEPRGPVLTPVAAAPPTITADPVTYSSILGGGGDATALACGAMADVEVRNSIVVGRGGAAFDIVCDAAITYSATESEYAGVGNVAIGDLTSGNQDVWFVDYVGNDFHVNTPPAAVLTTAEWTIVDPVVDIDGDARPTVDGTADFAGADVVP